MALPANAIAGIRGWNSGRNPWCGFRKLFVVGLGSSVQSGARPRGHGNGRRENDGHDGAFLGLRGTFLTLLVGSLLGSVIGIGLIVSVVPRGLEERSGKAREPPGTGDGAPIAMGDCEAIPVAAGTFLGLERCDRVWETADCGLLA